MIAKLKKSSNCAVFTNYLSLLSILGLSQKSIEIIIMCAFGAHMINEVTRSQMASASKFFLGAADRQVYKGEKSQMMKPLAMAFLSKK